MWQRKRVARRLRPRLSLTAGLRACHTYPKCAHVVFPRRARRGTWWSRHGARAAGGVRGAGRPRSASAGRMARPVRSRGGV